MLVPRAGRIIRYTKGTVYDAIGVVLEVTFENPSKGPGCRVCWLYNPPDECEEAWVLSIHLEVIL